MAMSESYSDMGCIDPDPPDKPPARTYADTEGGFGTFTLSDPQNSEAWITSDRMVNVGDRR